MAHALQDDGPSMREGGCQQVMDDSEKSRPDVVTTPPEVANTGPGVNRVSGGGARECGFEERASVHARTGGIHVLWLFCLRVTTKVAV